MKQFSIIALLIVACNQAVYDEVYKNIIEQTLATDLKAENIQWKNQTIEKLRDLCEGQRSTYETGVLKELAR
jgi:hypothetical protein